MAEAEAELRALNDEPIGTVRLGTFQSAIHTLAVPRWPGSPTRTRTCTWNWSSPSRTRAGPRCGPASWT